MQEASQSALQFMVYLPCHINQALPKSESFATFFYSQAHTNAFQFKLGLQVAHK